MPQLREAHGAHEDWTGLKDAKSRRKLQNRLNVRAHRTRKALEAQRARPGSLDALQPSKTLSRIRASPALNQILEQSAFPLSSDHLITLVQYNLLRASLTNMAILSLLHTLPDDCHDLWGHLPLFPAPTRFPESLAPTALQLRAPHNPWIDMLPDSTLRDNAIAAGAALDWQDMRVDLVGGLCAGRDHVELTGILAWSDPWCPEGWEVTEGFARKWAFLLRGCERLMRATNGWRARRGEEPLVVEL